MIGAPASRAPRLASLSIVALTMGVVAMGVVPAGADPDLWGHLRFGLDLIDTGRVDRPDIYSFLTTGVPWVNHEWLAEWLIAVAWRLAAGHGLILLKAIVCLTTFAIVYRHLVWRGLSLLAASMLLMTAIPLTLPWVSNVRPQIFTYLGFVITLVSIVRAEHGAPRALWVLPVVFVCWANLHGGVLAGLGVIGLWLVARGVAGMGGAVWRDGDAWKQEKAIWLPAIVAMLATVANPYAARMWLFFQTALVSRLEITEWNPIEMMSIEGAAHVAQLVPIVAGWFWSRREKKPALVFLFLVVAVLPMLARRNSPLFALGLVILGGEHLADAASRLVEWWRGDARAVASAPPPAAARRDVPIPAIAVLVFFLAAAACWVRAVSDLRITFGRETYPVEAVGLLRASGVRTNLAVPMNWGEYVLWHAGPDIKVSMDGRRETVYTKADYLEVNEFAFGINEWDRLLRRPGVDLALVPTKEWAAYNLLMLKPGWTPLYVDERSALFGRQGSPAAERIAQLPRPPKDDRLLLTFP